MADKKSADLPIADQVEANMADQLVSKLQCEKQKSQENRAKDLDDPDDREVELQFGSGRSSACDCPAHIHDRESPLLIAQVRDAVRVSRTITNSLSDICSYDF